MRLFLEELLIGFEFKNFLIALTVLFIVYLAWESTYVRDYNIQPNAVLIIERNRRLLVDIGPNVRQNLREQTGWSVETVQRADTSTEQVVSQDSESNLDESSRNRSDIAASSIPEPPPSLEVVIEEVHGLASVRHQINENAFQTLESFEEGIGSFFDSNDSGPQHLMQAMDTADGVRRRNLTSQTNENNVNSSELPEISEVASTSSVQGGGDTTIRNEVAKDKSSDSKSALNCDVEKENTSSSQEARNDEFTIKLKYMNDDTKLVKANPNEMVGDFMKRNFALEISAQKLIRLVFNGHLLQPDSQTLKAFGLFDMCVVHCIIFNRKYGPTQYGNDGQTSIDGTPLNTTTQTQDGNSSDQSGGNVSIHESSNHLIAMYACIAFITLFLTLCWYCRIHYHVFFSWYSTLVLILVTIIFSILGPLLIFIENNEVQRTT